ncbi:MAG: RNA 2',3'-cyclic phosphodiesterase [Clostridia bacterium]|nr:RNA 2',3'-cyclic phosphodiesterase [Clostridia bacterium]
MRLFAGLRPSEEFRAALSVLQSRLQAAGVTAKYLDPSNLHMTLAFIGEWPENITALLPAVDQPFQLTLTHAGIFPEAKVIWAGTEPSDALDQLANQVRSRLSEAGIPFDPKPFVPHITLGRKPAVPAEFELSIIEIPSAVMTVREVCLFRSDREENGMVYSVIGKSAV